MLSHIYSSHKAKYGNQSAMHWLYGLRILDSNTCYITIIILIIEAYNMTLDLWPVSYNAQLMYTTYIQCLLSTFPCDPIINTQ